MKAFAAFLVVGVVGAPALARPLPEPRLVCGDDLSACDRSLLWDSAQVPNSPATLADALLACVLKGQDLPTVAQFSDFSVAGATYRAWVRPSPERAATVANIVDGSAGTLVKGDASKPEPFVCVRESFAVPTVDNPTSIAANDPLYGLASDWIAALQALPESPPKIDASAASCRRDKVAGESTCSTEFTLDVARSGRVTVSVRCSVSDELIYPPEQACSVALSRTGADLRLAVGDELLVQSQPEAPADRFASHKTFARAKGKTPGIDMMWADVPATTLGAGVKAGHLLIRAGLVDVTLSPAHRTSVAWVLARLRRLLIEGIQRKAAVP